ncbi:MAG: phosphopantothenoylcysteine decarboxylase [Terrimicrobiaceae bacterium]
MLLMPVALVTCGPAYEPIDEVRRITNQSTGELGTILAETLAGSGFEVLCLRGEATTRPEPTNAKVLTFSTNASLWTLLEKLTIQPAAVFHAAALCDFVVHAIEGVDDAQKIRSTTAELRLILRPAVKVLPRLRTIFPQAVIVGWKYELDGSRPEAIARARKQINSSSTDACIVNGAAYGAGFGFVTLASEDVSHFPDKASLCEFLAKWTLEKLTLP